MRLHVRSWTPPGPTDAPTIVCVHGITQHGGVFEQLAQRLVAGGHRVLAVDLRGHGESGRLPPWTVAAHVQDLLDTADAEALDRPVWVAHSLGGLIAAALADRAPERVGHLALLDPALDLDPDQALMLAENDRLDWSFESVDAAVDALLAAGFLVATPRETLMTYAGDDLRPGDDGRLRFRFLPSAAVTAWSEMTLPAPPVARVPTLLARVEVPLLQGPAPAPRYRDALGPLLTEVTLPNGHNIPWEAVDEAAAAIRAFLD